MSKPIPVDFTTPVSSETPVAPSNGIHCSCGKKLTGECNCERVTEPRRPLRLLTSIRQMLKTPLAAAAHIPPVNATAAALQLRISPFKGNPLVLAASVLQASALVLM
jgi:hypothetical protein